MKPTLTELHEFYVTAAKLLKITWKVALPAALAGRVFSKITNLQLCVAVVASLVVRNRAQKLQHTVNSRYFVKDPIWCRKQGLDIAKFAVSKSIVKAEKQYPWHYKNLLKTRQLMVCRAQIASPDFSAAHYLNTDAVRTIKSLSSEELEGLWEGIEWTPKSFGIMVSHPAFQKLDNAQKQYVLKTYGEHFAFSTCSKKSDHEIEMFVWMRKKLQADYEQLPPQDFLTRHGYDAFKKPWSVPKNKLLTAVKKQATLKGFLREFGAGGVGGVIPIKGHLGELILQYFVPKLKAYLDTDEGRQDDRPLQYLFRWGESLWEFRRLKDKILQELEIPTFRARCGEEYDALQLGKSSPLFSILSHEQYDDWLEGLHEDRNRIKELEASQLQTAIALRKMGIVSHSGDTATAMLRSNANDRCCYPSEAEVRVVFGELAQSELSETLVGKLNPVIDAHWKSCEEHNFDSSAIAKPKWPFKALSNESLSMLFKIPSDAEQLDRMRLIRETMKGILLLGSWQPSEQFKAVMARLRGCQPRCNDNAVEQKRKRQEAFPLICELREMLYFDMSADAEEKLASLDAARAEWLKEVESGL